MNKIDPLYLALGGAVTLAFISESYPKIGGAILLLVILSMLQTAARKGML